MKTKVADPKCPDCGIRGLENILSTESIQQSHHGEHWFDIVFCKNCGHIYGVFAKVVNSAQPTSRPFFEPDLD